jgi:hypothetical protein
MMIEFFQILWNPFMLRDAARKGQLTVGVWVFTIGFVVLLYAILLPATVLWQNHPQYKPVFVAAVVLDGIVFVVGMLWAWKLRAELIASRADASMSGDK